MQKKMKDMFNRNWEYRKTGSKKKFNATEKRLKQLMDDLEVKMPIVIDETNNSQNKQFILGT